MKKLASTIGVFMLVIGCLVGCAKKQESVPVRVSEDTKQEETETFKETEETKPPVQEISDVRTVHAHNYLEDEVGFDTKDPTDLEAMKFSHVFHVVLDDGTHVCMSAPPYNTTIRSRERDSRISTNNYDSLTYLCETKEGTPLIVYMSVSPTGKSGSFLTKSDYIDYINTEGKENMNWHFEKLYNGASPLLMDKNVTGWQQLSKGLQIKLDGWDYGYESFGGFTTSDGATTSIRYSAVSKLIKDSGCVVTVAVAADANEITTVNLRQFCLGFLFTLRDSSIDPCYN